MTVMVIDVSLVVSETSPGCAFRPLEAKALSNVFEAFLCSSRLACESGAKSFWPGWNFIPAGI